jgi:hypothetical protein
MLAARPSCLRLFTQETDCALERALLTAGISMPAKMAMMAMTVRSSIKVKAFLRMVFSRMVGSIVKEDSSTIILGFFAWKIKGLQKNKGFSCKNFLA